MEKLAFRIIFVPWEEYPTDLKPYLQEIKQRISDCGLENITVSLSKINNKKDESTASIEEIVFQVYADSRQKNYYHESQYYSAFCSNWQSLFFPKPCPLILLHENNSFLNQGQTVHNFVLYTSMSFGVLPYNGEFHQYVELPLIGHANFLHDERKVCIKYSTFELSFEYSNIRNIFVSIDMSPTNIYFDLCNPPLLFKTELRHSRSRGTYTIRKMTCSIDYCFENYEWETLDSDTLGRSNVLKLSIKHPKIANELIGRLHFKCSEKPIHYGYISCVKKTKPVIPSDFEWNHFGCSYLITAIFNRNFTMAAQSLDLYNSLFDLMALNLENEECMEKALTLILSAIDSGKILNFWLAIKEQFKFYINNKKEIDFMHYIVPEKCCMIRRITLTPTRQLLWPPEIMLGNRIIRNFNSEYALRISFRDDNHSKLSFNAKNAEEAIFEKCIKETMKNGIPIGSRRYEFLAWSNSQIRDHGVWMYAQDPQGNTVSTIRSWMGDFSHIHSVSKYMARMGQCFSQTEDTVTVPFDSIFIRTEDDIEGGFDEVNEKPYCFSDGIGKISSELAAKVHDALGHDKLCSAFQIRYGGYKGMLVIDPTLEDTEIVFRKSMKKFDSPESIKLEIAKTSGPTPLQLNRPLITLLNGLGIEARVFLKLQGDMLKNLTDMLFDEEQANAYLIRNNPMAVFCYKELTSAGIHLTTEPFFRSLLLTLHRHHIDKIKKKANITIDPDKGRNMLGVLDETGLLNEGEVFVHITEDISYGETRQETTILKGPVMVTKNPCMLPGDVRKFKAVNKHELHHITDCIVFPQKGSRPHPSEMAGSDLDGDEYSVFWHEDLIIDKENQPPGNFRSYSEETKDSIQVEDMIDFLIKYIKNDQVGSIANTHLAQADLTSIDNKWSISIAEKFAIAVDFPKTGVSTYLSDDERPKKFPDFQERRYGESYKSRKALGMMYRVAKDYESETEEASLRYRNVQVDEDLIFPGWEDYKENAITTLKKYVSLLETILRNYGIEHEAEVFSGAFTNFHCHFKDRKDRNDIEKIILLCIKCLSENIRKEFLEEFTTYSNVSTIDENMLKKASAWYVVTYTAPNPKVLSFPWIVSNYLINIKTLRCRTSSHISPIILKTDEQINRLGTTYQILGKLDEKVAKYHFACERNVVRKALGVMTIWAQNEKIIAVPNSVKLEGFMLKPTFNTLFFIIAEKVGYIAKDNDVVIINKTYSPAALCLEFLWYCSQLRFYSKEELLNVIPFSLNKYKTLSARALISYHRFAVLGNFQIVFTDSTIGDLVEMMPIYIESKIFQSSPINNGELKNAENLLKNYSCAQEVSLREIRQTKKIVVSAVGTEKSLRLLKYIVREKHETLKHFFFTGKLPNR